jgi:hypothetical protein
MPACLPEEEENGDPIEKFLGQWKVNETCSRMNYNVEIVNDPSASDQVLIYNFGNPGPGYDPVVGVVDGYNIYVDNQTTGEGWTITNGTGYYNALTDQIEWDYTLTIPPNEYNCSATYSWQ